MENNLKFSSRELFRYVKIEKPKIIDVEFRIKQNPRLSFLLEMNKAEKKKWAKEFIKSDKVINQISDFRFPYIKYLKNDTLDSAFLPSVKDIKETEELKAVNFKENDDYKADRENILASVIAYRFTNKTEKLAVTTKLLSFVEDFPSLVTMTRRQPYLTPVFNKTKFNVSKKPIPPVVEGKNSEEQKHTELMVLANDLKFFWNLKNQMKKAVINEYDKAILELQRLRFIETAKKTSKKTAAKKKNNKSSKRKIDRELQKRHLVFLKDRNEQLASLREKRRELTAIDAIEVILRTDSDVLSKYSNGMSTVVIAQKQAQTQTAITTYNVDISKFCQAYEAVIDSADKLSSPSTPFEMFKACFRENPIIAFDNSVRILGSGNLVKVDETFIGYKPTEVSYIENILPGEFRRREIKNTRYFEQNRESVQEETTDKAQESSSTSTQELSSEIENEINSRFNSDVNASVNASGSGSIGVAELSGGAAVDAGLGIGIDTSMATSNTSEFSQEIINKAVERTKKYNLDRRSTRSYSLFETTNVHEIDNRNGDAKNGIYVYLDKEVCIKETPYGRRLFLLANVILPGRNLLCENLVRISVNLVNQGQRPVFEISPEDIHPNNYRELAGKFRASNVLPPPPAIQTIARTYKTDTTNANVEQQKFNLKEIADTLVPIFEKYQRYIITDIINVPKGYQAQEATVTVNHGKNGISIPGHLPLKLPIAALYVPPAIVGAIPTAGLSLPIAFWQIAYFLSPLLHYNTDSSNITVNIGNESQDSDYYFFSPEFLIQEVFTLLGNFSAITPDILETIRENINELLLALGEKAVSMSKELGEMIGATVQGLASQFTDIFNALQNLLNPLNAGAFDANFNLFIGAISDLNSNISETYSELMSEEFFEPLRTFLNDTLNMITAELSSALAEFFEFITTMSDNSENLNFVSFAGTKGDLPVSLNAVSMKPGITVNLTVCAIRTDEALDQWRLDTFSNFYQAYLQQMAEYENRLFTMNPSERMAHPEVMRQDERQAIKELVLHTLNNYHTEKGNTYDLQHINFFENAIDWNNMSYRLYNYGPNLQEIMRDKLGAFHYADERRRVFLKAHWAQVLIPVHGNPYLEGQVMQYFADGTFDFEGGFTEDELTALYQELILGYELQDQLESTSRLITIPTDLVIIQDELPENPDITC